MADYSFERFNSRDFEHFIQALSQKLLGCGVVIFGDGPDGAREATYEGKCSFPGHIECWDGYWVIQSKFKQRLSDDDYTWVKKEFESEMKKFEVKAKRGLRIPQNYLFFTNAKLTPVEERGGRDKIEKLCEKYRTNLIPNIKIYGFDDICRFLDNNRDVAISYSSFILPGDILYKMYEMLTSIEPAKDHSSLLARFLEKEFKEDTCSRLEQGGQLTNKKINLERVFVDLDATEDGLPPNGENCKFANTCIEIGNSVLKPPNNINRFVLIGGPGQGKSTLTQYLCQMYRAHFLRNVDTAMELPVIRTFINEFESTELNRPTCVRFPFRIVLKDYASWLFQQQKDCKPLSILAYIKYKIENKGNGIIELEEVRQLLRSLSFIFLFDGLDEVPNTSNRNEVMDEINFFIDTEIRREKCDALIIATTRPQGYAKEFDEFKHLFLTDLSKKDCLGYLNRLMFNIEESEEQRNQHINILTRALDNETASILMRSPLQATIMAILVLSGGDPPRNRYSLFSDYYKVILTRERQKRVLQVLVDNPEYINAIHHKLGFQLQLMSEGKDNPSATISFRDFEKFISSYLVLEMGLDTNTANSITNQILEAITERLVFISEVQQGRVGFNIRSIQEYFAANYFLSEHDAIIPSRLKYISKSSYWRNTFLLGTGYLYNNRNYLIGIVDSICRELNGSSEDYDYYNGYKISKIGSWLALDILNEGVFRGKPIEENKYCNYLEELFKIAPSINHMYFGKLPNDIQLKWVGPLIEKYVKSELETERITAWTIAIHLIKHGNGEIIDIIESHWPKERKESYIILKNVIELGLENTDFIIAHFIDFLKDAQLFMFKEVLTKENFVHALVQRSNCMDKKTKAYLIQNLFFNTDFRSSKFILQIANKENNHNRIILPISKRHISCELCKDYSLGFISTTMENSDLLKEIFIEHNIEYLVALLDFLQNPNKKTLVYFLKSLQMVSIDAFTNMRNNAINFSWFLAKVFSQISTQDEIVHVLEKINNGLFGDTIEWLNYEAKIKGSKLTFHELLENMEYAPRRIAGAEASFRTFYQYYIENKDSATPKQLNILKNELVRSIYILEEEFNIEDETVKKDIIEAISECDYTKFPTAYANTLFFIFSLLNQNDIWGILKDGKVTFDLWPLTTQLYMESVNHQECFNKILKIMAVSQIESSIIKLLLTIYFNQGNNEFIVDNNSINDMQKVEYKNEELEGVRIILGFLNKNIDIVVALNLTEQVLKIAESFPEILKYLISLFEIARYKQSWVEAVLATVYKAIKDKSLDINLISRYEQYLKNLCESYPSGICE